MKVNVKISVRIKEFFSFKLALRANLLNVLDWLKSLKQ